MIFDNILIYFVIVPVLTLGGLALCQNKGIKAIRTVAVTGASVLMALALYLVYYFLQQHLLLNMHLLYFYLTNFE